MPIDDIEVTKKIFERFYKEFSQAMDVDVAIAGAGPAAMVAARKLAHAGKKVVIFERKLAPGGGMWGGGMNFPVIVVQEESKHLLEEVGVNISSHGDGYHTADSVESVCKLMSGAIDAGARLFNTMSVVDVMMRENRVTGFVINWTGVELAKMHVDPLTIRAKFLIDGTGHPSEVASLVARKTGRLSTPSGGIEGERSMWADVGEQTVVENTGEVYPGLYVMGMAANAVHGSPRMGPIFGGMLLSGEKAAKMILEKLG
ncbi:MAG: sulfide-dependent adenosine diphosphate thiazole synthase [Candidatus Thermoplasmatota archaeon]|nr:sulfide-dependent adenosine diphosphate thiazole synthase [Candidatus Thermoplasmatota archaeon]